MRNILFSVVVALGATSFAVNAQVDTFEDAGIVQSVQLGANVIGVNDKFYSLPNSVEDEGVSVILKLKPGYLVGFSGTLSMPYNRIDSLYLYPESVIEVEQNLKNFPAANEGAQR